MYYEEKVIDGVLCEKNSPDGEWKQVSYEQLLGRYQLTERNLTRLLEKTQAENACKVNR